MNVHRFGLDSGSIEKPGRSSLQWEYRGFEGIENTFRPLLTFHRISSRLECELLQFTRIGSFGSGLCQGTIGLAIQKFSVIVPDRLTFLHLARPSIGSTMMLFGDVRHRQQAGGPGPAYRGRASRALILEPRRLLDDRIKTGKPNL